VEDSAASDKAQQAFESEYIAVANIGKPIGLKGWCRIFPFGRTIEVLTVPVSLKAGKDTPRLSVEIAELQNDVKGYKARFTGYTDIEAIDTLKNYRLFIPRRQLPKRSPDEYFHFELEGMRVLDDKTNECIGTIVKVHNYPTTDALEVRKESGYTFVIPMNREAVTKIDGSAGTILINKEIIDELL